jgi:hypothetical protein
MAFLPLLLALIGVFAGRMIALKRKTCPHRGKVWGAFTFPLVALLLPSLQFQALALSLAAALAAGFTAHRPVRTTLIAVLVAGVMATAAVHYSGF